VKREWLVPLTGVVFLVLAIVSFTVGGEPPEANEPVREIIEHYVDNKDSIEIGAGMAGVAAMFLIFFGAYLRKVLAAAEGEGGILSHVVLIGTAIMALGIAIDGTISIAIAEAAEDVRAAAIQAMQALWDNDFLPIALGVEVFLVSAGLSIVRHGALPKWLGWVALVLALAGPTPAGFVAFLGGAVWVAIVSVVLALRARGPGAAAAPTTPTTPAT
jgi:hypothetical protein